MGNTSSQLAAQSDSYYPGGSSYENQHSEIREQSRPLALPNAQPSKSKIRGTSGEVANTIVVPPLGNVQAAGLGHPRLSSHHNITPMPHSTHQQDPNMLDSSFEDELAVAAAITAVASRFIPSDASQMNGNTRLSSVEIQAKLARKRQRAEKRARKRQRKLARESRASQSVTVSQPTQDFGEDDYDDPASQLRSEAREAEMERTQEDTRIDSEPRRKRTRDSSAASDEEVTNAKRSKTTLDNEDMRAAPDNDDRGHTPTDASPVSSDAEHPTPVVQLTLSGKKQKRTKKKTTKKRVSRGEKETPIPKDRIVTGAYSTQELDLIDTLVDEFREEREMTDDGFRNAMQASTEGGEASQTLSDLVALLRKNLPNRPRRSLRKFCQRKYNNYIRGAWDADQDEALRQAYEEKPKMWVSIGQTLGRMPEDCRDRWRNHVSLPDAHLGTWTDSEIKQLSDVVAECVAKLRASDDRFDDDVPDHVIEEYVNFDVVSTKLDGIRSRLQCRSKWMHMTGRRRRGGSKKGKKSTKKKAKSAKSAMDGEGDEEQTTKTARPRRSTNGKLPSTRRSLRKEYKSDDRVTMSDDEDGNEDDIVDDHQAEMDVDDPIEDTMEHERSNQTWSTSGRIVSTVEIGPSPEVVPASPPTAAQENDDNNDNNDNNNSTAAAPSQPYADSRLDVVPSTAVPLSSLLNDEETAQLPISGRAWSDEAVYSMMSDLYALTLRRPRLRIDNLKALTAAADKYCSQDKYTTHDRLFQYARLCEGLKKLRSLDRNLEECLGNLEKNGVGRRQMVNQVEHYERSGSDPEDAVSESEHTVIENDERDLDEQNGDQSASFYNSTHFGTSARARSRNGRIQRLTSQDSMSDEEEVVSESDKENDPSTAPTDDAEVNDDEDDANENDDYAESDHAHEHRAASGAKSGQPSNHGQHGHQLRSSQHHDESHLYDLPTTEDDEAADDEIDTRRSVGLLNSVLSHRDDDGQAHHVNPKQRADPSSMPDTSGSRNRTGMLKRIPSRRTRKGVNRSWENYRG